MTESTDRPTVRLVQRRTIRHTEFAVRIPGRPQGFFVAKKDIEQAREHAAYCNNMNVELGKPQIAYEIVTRRVTGRGGNLTYGPWKVVQ